MFTPGSTGSTAYLIESNRTIREVTVLRAAADMVTVRLGAGAERVRASRLRRSSAVYVSLDGCAGQQGRHRPIRRVPPMPRIIRRDGVSCAASLTF